MPEIEDSTTGAGVARTAPAARAAEAVTVGTRRAQVEIHLPPRFLAGFAAALLAVVAMLIALG